MLWFLHSLHPEYWGVFMHSLPYSANTFGYQIWGGFICRIFILWTAQMCAFATCFVFTFIPQKFTHFSCIIHKNILPLHSQMKERLSILFNKLQSALLQLFIEANDNSSLTDGSDNCYTGAHCGTFNRK